MKIYTKSGDGGYSHLKGGFRVHKSDEIFGVLGTLDELNSFLGVAATFIPENTGKKKIRKIQDDLFLIGDCFAGKTVDSKTTKYLEARLSEIETNIDKMEKVNRPLKNFILPGGTKASAFIHLGRATCRRLERVVCHYVRKENRKDSEVIIKYLNRISDYLFVLARYYNSKGTEDLVWKKGL